MKGLELLERLELLVGLGIFLVLIFLFLGITKLLKKFGINIGIDSKRTPKL